MNEVILSACSHNIIVFTGAEPGLGWDSSSRCDSVCLLARGSASLYATCFNPYHPQGIFPQLLKKTHFRVSDPNLYTAIYTYINSLSLEGHVSSFRTLDLVAT